MELDDFLNLPRKKKQPNDRILGKIRKMKNDLLGRVTEGYCDKKTYNSKRVAKKKVRRSKGTRIELTNYYFCDKCQGWHVTTTDSKEYWREKKSNNE